MPILGKENDIYPSDLLANDDSFSQRRSAVVVCLHTFSARERSDEKTCGPEK
jgi:hypothetical protein